MAPTHDHIEIIARILLQRGSSLLLCQDVAGGYYFLPGGHLDPGESARDAARREAVEETGLLLEIGHCALIAENIFHDGEQRRHEINMVFHVEHAGASPLPDPIASLEPHVAFHWIDRAAFVDLDLRPACIKAWLVAGDDLNEAGCQFVSVQE